ncbi:MAG: hypothetical protein ABRQ37_03490 [Candidatus Eremiobacterota bacterium]
MSQSKLKDYQKQLFEYDYTLKKIDNILISTRLPQEEREHYQMSREACQKAKNKTSQEMAEYAKENRLSLLIAPLSKEEKEELIQSMERGGGDSGEPIRFDDIREESFYVEEKTFMPESTGYKTKKLSEYVMNGAAEVDDNPEELDNRFLENGNLEVEELENGNLDSDNLEIEDLDDDIEDIDQKENDFDFDSEQSFSEELESDGNSLSFSPAVINFIRSLKNELALFYGE